MITRSEEHVLSGLRLGWATCSMKPHDSGRSAAAQYHFSPPEIPMDRYGGLGGTGNRGFCQFTVDSVCKILYWLCQIASLSWVSRYRPQPFDKNCIGCTPPGIEEEATRPSSDQNSVRQMLSMTNKHFICFPRDSCRTVTKMKPPIQPNTREGCRLHEFRVWVSAPRVSSIFARA